MGSDRLQNAVEIAKDIIVGEARNDKSLLDECGPTARRRAPTSSSVECVAPSTSNDELRVKRYEISNKIAKDHLPAKTKTCNLRPTQALPETTLGTGRIAPQEARRRR